MKKYIFISLLFLSLPYTAGAATVHIVQTPQEAGVGDTIAVSLSVDASTPINTFSGSLRYAQDKLQLTKVSDGGSIVSIWITRPQGEGGAVPFEGLVPGGYAGRGGVLFTAFFKVKEAGVAAVSLDSAVFLRNDGSGSAEEVSSKVLSFIVADKARGGFTESADTDPPEPFTIQLNTAADLFGGRPYAVFSASDKGSGVNYYEAAEQRIPFIPLRWQRVVSPYVLGDRYHTSDLYIKAVDNAGNERIASYPRPRLLRLYEWLSFGILIAVLFIYGKRFI